MKKICKSPSCVQCTSNVRPIKNGRIGREFTVTAKQLKTLTSNTSNVNTIPIRETVSMKTSREVKSAENRILHAKKNLELAQEALKHAEEALRDIYARARRTHHTHEAKNANTMDVLDVKAASH